MFGTDSVKHGNAGEKLWGVTFLLRFAGEETDVWKQQVSVETLLALLPSHCTHFQIQTNQKGSPPCRTVHAVAFPVAPFLSASKDLTIVQDHKPRLPQCPYHPGNGRSQAQLCPVCPPEAFPEC